MCVIFHVTDKRRMSSPEMPVHDVCTLSFNAIFADCVLYDCMFVVNISYKLSGGYPFDFRAVNPFMSSVPQKGHGQTA